MTKQTYKKTRSSGAKRRSKIFNTTVQRTKQPTDSTLGQIARLAGNGLSKFFGLGSYQLRSNSLYDSATGNQVPFMHSTNDTFTFRSREYVGDIYSTSAFAAKKFAVNPGLETSFPYLATIANNFAQYKFKGLVFEFKSTGAVALESGTNTAMGSVSLVANYNANETGPTTKIEALNSMWSASDRTSENVVLPIECAPDETSLVTKYIRSGTVTGDLRMNDICNVFVCTSGSQASNIVGELWISYEVEFLKPVLSNQGGLVRCDHYIQVDTMGTSAFGIIAQSRISTIGTVCANETITFPLGTVGVFLVDVYHKGNPVPPLSGAGTCVPTPTNCSVLSVLTNANINSEVSPDLVSGISTFSFSMVVKILDAAQVASVTMAHGALPAAASVDIIVCELDGDFN
jgi:hypothetical protein